MKHIWIIGLNTFHEAIRRKFQMVLFIAAPAIIAAGTFFTYMEPGAEGKMLISFGMGAILIFGLLIAVFMGTSLIPSEVERRTIFTILSKPVRRGEFLLGKLLGASMTIVANVFVMSVIFLVVLLYKTRGVDAVDSSLLFTNVAKALILFCVQFIVLVSIAIAISTVGSTVFNIIFTFIVFVIGVGSDSISNMIKRHGEAEGGGILLQGVLKAIYWIVPHFSNFDIRASITSDPPKFVPPADVVWPIVYAVAYMAAVMLLAWVAFRDREF